jgi:hypothetical protein
MTTALQNVYTAQTGTQTIGHLPVTRIYGSGGVAAWARFTKSSGRPWPMPGHPQLGRIDGTDIQLWDRYVGGKIALQATDPASGVVA